MRNQLQNGKTPHDGGIIWCSVLRSTIVWPTEASKRNKIERKNIAADQIDLIIRCARHSAKTISRTFWQSQIFSVVLNSFFFSSYANWPRPLNRNCDVMQRNARTSRRKKKEEKSRGTTNYAINWVLTSHRCSATDLRVNGRCVTASSLSLLCILHIDRDSKNSTEGIREMFLFWFFLFSSRDDRWIFLMNEKDVSERSVQQ